MKKDLEHIRKIDKKSEEIKPFFNMSDDDIKNMSESEVLEALKKVRELNKLLKDVKTYSDFEIEEKMKEVNILYGLTLEDIDNMSIEDMINLRISKSN